MALNDGLILGEETPKTTASATDFAEVADTTAPATESTKAHALTAEEDPSIGTLSDAWEVVAILVDERKPETIERKPYARDKGGNLIEIDVPVLDRETKEPKLDAEGNPVTRKGYKQLKAKKKTIYRSVGYRLRAKQDGLSYPQVPVVPRYATEPFLKPQGIEWKTASAGQEIDLLTIETFILASTKEVNDKFTGGEFPLHVKWSAVDPTSKKASKLMPSTGSFMIPKRFGRHLYFDVPSIKAIVVTNRTAPTDERYKFTGSVDAEAAAGFERFAPLTLKGEARSAATPRATKAKGVGRQAKVKVPVWDAQAAAFLGAVTERQG